MLSFQVLGFDIFWASLLLISAALVTEVAAGAGYLGRFGATSKVFNAMAAGVVSKSRLLALG